MQITSKGQVTIPIDLRNKLGLLPNTEVEFVLINNELVLRKINKPSTRGARLIQSLRGAATAGMSTEEIMALTRKE